MGKPVDENEWLYRRGYSKPEKNYMNPDGTATSRVFKLREKEKELSVDVKSMTSPEVSIKDPQRFMLFEIAHRQVLDLSLLAVHDPLPNEHSLETNPAHALIVGMDIEDEITPGLLAKASRRVLWQP
jgi:hypothetical protein